ncbi:MAG: M48 family metalloprotease [Candidatus Omnitrophica bacterium]|nr:M48 family metalloprotease [Candidatus Omnitrophota bacterium]
MKYLCKKFLTRINANCTLFYANHSRLFALDSRPFALRNYFPTLFLLTLFLQTGCSTEYNLATQRQETLIYGTEKEVKIGETVAPKIEAQYDMITDVDVNERVQRILGRIVAVCDRKDLVYFIKVIDDDPINAVSLPGGYVYVFRGLIDKVENDDELAAVIAHEVGHITARHGVKRMQGAYAALALQIASTQAGGNVASGVGLALNSLFMEYSKEDEFEADKLSVKYLKKAGYDPHAMVALLRKLKTEEDKEPLKEYSYWRTHPYITQRISMANQEIVGKLEFRDYLNLMGTD